MLKTLLVDQSDVDESQACLINWHVLSAKTISGASVFVLEERWHFAGYLFSVFEEWYDFIKQLCLSKWHVCVSCNDDEGWWTLDKMLCSLKFSVVCNEIIFECELGIETIVGW
jgi:hypothetical protein